MSHYLIFDGEFVPVNELSVSPLNRGMMYGDGCFETFRSYQGRFLHVDDHLQRLRAGLEYLGFQPFENPGLFKDELSTLIEKNGLSNVDAMVRIQCWREGSRGYGTVSRTGHWLAEVKNLPNQQSGMTLKTVSVHAIPSMSLNRAVKLSNGLNYIKAAQEAQSAGFDDALMLTIHKKISETTVANVFWVKGNRIFTPSLNCDLLPGITRNLITRCIHSAPDLELTEGEFETDELRDAEAMFVTNSLREIQPVNRCDDHHFDPDHDVIVRLRALFQSYKTGHLK